MTFHKFLIIIILCCPVLVRAQWQEMAEMPTPRHSAAAVAVDHYIYVIGGSSAESAALGIVERYDTINDVWVI